MWGLGSSRLGPIRLPSALPIPRAGVWVQRCHWALGCQEPMQGESVESGTWGRQDCPSAREQGSGCGLCLCFRSRDNRAVSGAHGNGSGLCVLIREPSPKGGPRLVLRSEAIATPSSRGPCFPKSRLSIGPCEESERWSPGAPADAGEKRDLEENKATHAVGQGDGPQPAWARALCEWAPLCLSSGRAPQGDGKVRGPVGTWASESQADRRVSAQTATCMIYWRPGASL